MNSADIHLETNCIPAAIWHRPETQNASLRGQLKGLHHARRTRGRQLEEQLSSWKAAYLLEKDLPEDCRGQLARAEHKIGQLPKFTP